MPTPNLNDWELLQSYAVEDSERAFDLLVERYLGLVYSAALRQVRDPHLAEEVCQAVFVILGRKAGRLPRNVVLAGWLFRTTRFVAARAVRTEERRHCREREAAEMQTHTHSEPAWEDVEPMLDEAITSLAAKDRAAVLLRYLQRKSLRQVGEELGTTEDGARKRVDRAVEKLRAFFAGRGLPLSAAFLSGMLSGRAVQAAPAHLSESVRSATRAVGPVLPAALLLLVNGTLREMGWAKAKTVGALALAASIAVIAICQATHNSTVQKAARQSMTHTARGRENEILGKDNSTAQAGETTVAAKLPLRVVDARQDHPLSGAAVVAKYFGRALPDDARLDLNTDEFGLCEVPWSDRDFDTLRVWVSASGHVPKLLNWHKYEFKVQPEEYVVRLDPGDRIGGMVKDDLNQPVFRAKLQVFGVGMVLSQRENIGYRPDLTCVFTDAQGRWLFDQASKGVDTLTFFVTHPEYAKAMVTLPLAALDPTNHLIVMSRGLGVQGTVLNRLDLPIAEALVNEIDPYGGPAVSGETDLFGRFKLDHVNAGLLKLQIHAKGYQSLKRTVLVSTNSEEFSFVLDEAAPEQSAPASAFPSRTIRLAGRAVDQETGRPVDRFRVLLDERRGLASPDLVGEGRAGAFDWEYPATYFSAYSIEVQAEGYMPEASAPVQVSAGEHFFEFKLTKSADITGRVLFPDGTATVGAEVWLGGEDFGPIMVMTIAKKPALHPGNDDWSLRTQTDSKGVFRFKPRRAANRVVVAHDWGCAAVSINSLALEPVVLEPWGRITGVVRMGTRPGGNCTLGIQRQGSLPDSLEVPYSHPIQTDGQGRFAFDRVPPGKYRVYRVTSLHGDSPGYVGYSHYTAVEVLPGETSQTMIGGGGRTVVGRVKTVPTQFMPHWTTILQTLAVPSTGTPPAAPKDTSDRRAFRIYDLAWRDYDAKQQRYYFGLNPDGSFVVEDVLPGAYRLQITLTAPPKDPLDHEAVMLSMHREIGSLTCEVVVSEALSDQPDQPFDLGTINLRVNEGPDGK